MRDSALLADTFTSDLAAVLRVPAVQVSKKFTRRYFSLGSWFDFRNGGRRRHGNQRELVEVRRRLAKERRRVIDTARGGELFSSLSHSLLAQTEAR